MKHVFMLLNKTLFIVNTCNTERYIQYAYLLIYITLIPLADASIQNDLHIKESFNILSSEPKISIYI